jgi:hypothetical protein
MYCMVTLHNKLAAISVLGLLLLNLLLVSTYLSNDLLCLLVVSSQQHHCDHPKQFSQTVTTKHNTWTNPSQIVNQIWLPPQPDSEVEERLKNRMRVADSDLVEISPLAICSATSQVSILQYADGSWKLVSRDRMGNVKTVGGDEYYVTYTDVSSQSGKATLVAINHDNGDGTYDLNFSTTPMNSVGRPNTTAKISEYAYYGPVVHPRNTNILGCGYGYGNVTVHLEYTCGVGAMGQPLKDTWQSGGAIGVSWTRDNVTSPSYRFFAPPIDTGIDWSAYNLVVGFGDSIMEGFFKVRKVPEALKILHRPNTTAFRGGASMELNNQTVDLQMDKLRRAVGSYLNQTNVALVIGSSVWDLLSLDTVDPDFKSHLAGARRFVQQLELEYPNMSLYWKSASAMQPQNLHSRCWRFTKCRHRTRYMSNSRAKILFEKQKSLMLELGIPFLDLWEAYYLSGDHMENEDGRHYNNDINKLMQSWFYRGKKTEV